MCIFIISIILLTLNYMFSNVESSSNILKNESNLLQAELSAESIINIVLSDEEELKKSCKEIYNGSKNKLVENINTYVLDDIEDLQVNLSLDNTYEENGFLLESKLQYRGIDASCYSKGTIVNPVYTLGVDVLNKNTLESKEIEKLIEEYSNINIDSFEKINVVDLDSGTYYLKKEELNFIVYSEIIEYDENGESFTVENILYKYPISKGVFLNQKEGILVVEDNLNLYGVFNLSEVYLSEDLNIKGLLALNGSVNNIENTKNIVVEGILVNLLGLSENNVVSNYNFKYLKNYSNYIPGFFDIIVRAIEKSKVEI
ncbi:hypothetical protein [Anaerosphaera aminiphila]|uniref:hypothetical protein n=1 Tax=Anaerosphaera aminiphila TaxID=1120994 RepID=UPI001178CE09|nr:hypothetical protein [Anaerosphaera aminiphila]